MPNGLLPAAKKHGRRLNARAARKTCAGRPLDERIALVAAGVARIGGMTDEIVPELAHMMGRPVRHGGQFGGVGERASCMAGIAQEALKPLVIKDSGDFGPTVSLPTSASVRSAAIGARIETGTMFMNRTDCPDPALCRTGLPRKRAGAARSASSDTGT